MSIVFYITYILKGTNLKWSKYHRPPSQPSNNQFIDSNIFMLSAELGYYDLGGFSGPGYDVDSDAFTLAAVGYIPIGPFFEVYAKFGVASVSVDTSIGNNSKDSSSEDAFGGLGFAFDILDTIDIYAEYLRFDNRIDSELYGIGVRFDFFWPLRTTILKTCRWQVFLLML